MSITISNAWRNTIKIKEDFIDDNSPEAILKITKKLQKEVRRIEKREMSSNLSEDDLNHVLEEIELILDNLRFLSELCSGEIPEEDWYNYGFQGDFQGEFNGILSQVYDLGDVRVTTKNGVQEKFIWVD